jgi:hypothetical protein
MLAASLSCRRCHLWVLASAIILGIAACGQAGAPDRPDSDTPPAPVTKAEQPVPTTKHLPVHLGKIPSLTLAPRPPLDGKREAALKNCIRRLADIDRPDYGLSPTMSGAAFLPLADQHQARVLLLTDHRLKSSEALRALVAAGPDALPLLLASLGDKTPTRLKVVHESAIGAMWFANELRGNPVNPTEAKVFAQRDPPPPFGEEKTVHSYTVKVGDICFVAVGQIVGRGYQAVRYQPTACIVINSPTADKKLREQVRSIWSGKDPARHLFDSLLLDYSTVGNYKEGDSFDEWGVGSDLQIAAAMRLLYYFPKETAPMIARRLRGLRVQRTGPAAGSYHTDAEMTAWKRREVANGARTDQLVKAVAWCKEPAVRAEVRSVFKRTGDVDILLAALPALDEDDAALLRDRLAAFLDRVPRDGRAAYGDGYNLLSAILTRAPRDAKPLFVRYLRPGTALRRYSVCQLLLELHPDWSVELLVPFLDDKRPVGGYAHPASADDTENSVLIRVCDAAAETLSRTRPGLTFTMVGTARDLDRQIDVIRKQLARPKK